MLEKYDAYYDSIADGYDELYGEEQLKKLTLIKKYFSPESDKTLLDVGCGTGISIAFWNCKRFGIDPSKRLIDKAHKKDIIECKVASAEDIPYSNNFFDHVISLTAIQNFNDIKKGLSEIKRVGKSSFVLTFLKKSDKRKIIETLIEELFIITKKIEEDKDIIYFCS